MLDQIEWSGLRAWLPTDPVPLEKRRGDGMLTVIVPTRGRSTRLLLTLRALLSQGLSDERLELIVVDDAESDSPVQRVLAMLPGEAKVELLHSRGGGVARARNLGAEHARGEILLFLDDDTVCGEAVLHAHLAAHADHASRIVHGRVTDLSAFRFAADPDEPSDVLRGALDRSLRVDDVPLSATTAARLGPRRSLIEKAALAVQRPEFEELRWLSCVGTNTSLRPETLDRVGGFDVRYGALWGGEDLELGIRLHRTNKVDFRLTDTSAYHLGMARKDTNDSLGRFWRLAAEYHGDPGLLAVAEFLRGQIDLLELRRRQHPNASMQSGIERKGWS